jgi:hypothetical protein
MVRLKHSMIFRKKTAQEKSAEKNAKEISQAKFHLHKLFSIRLVRISIIAVGLIILMPIPFFLTAHPKVQKNINYGATFSDKYATQLGLDWRDTYIKVLDDLKIKNIRLVAYWDDIEKVQDQYDYSNIRWQVEEAQKRNVNVILAVGRKVPRYPECFEPKWWKDTKDENIRDGELLEYVKTTVNEFKQYDSIKTWQVENEPYWPFGECTHPIKTSILKKEINVVRNIDHRPILIQDSGEGGYWLATYRLGDKLGISMYRKIWYDFWGAFFNKFIYFQYPLAYWSYKIKADVVGVPYEDIYVTELQGEPWGPGINSSLSDEEKAKSMSRTDFLDTINYAQKAGFKDLYFWGVEWWLWEKDFNNNPYFWNTAKAIIN